MGSVIKGIGSVLGPIASAAAPLIPGVGGVLASVLGSAGAAQHAASGANAATSSIQNIGNDQAAQYQKYISQIQPALLSQAGFGADGSYNPNGAVTPYGSDADIQRRAQDFYNTSNLTAPIVANREATNGNYDAAVAATQNDALNRGFTQGDTVTDSQDANTRRAQAESNAGYARNLNYQNTQNANNYVQQQQAARAGLQTGTLGNLASLTSGSAQGALGTLGGLQGFYANQGQNIANGQAGALGSLASSGGLGSFDLGSALGLNKILGIKRTQSTSPGTTTAQASSSNKPTPPWSENLPDGTN